MTPRDEVNNEWFKKPLFSKLEDSLTYQKHSEICGCWEIDTAHTRHWSITVRFREDEVRELMGLLNDRASMKEQGEP